MPTDSHPAPRRLQGGLLVAGSEMASFTIVGVLVDYAVGTLPLFTVLLTLLGVAAAFFHLTRMVKVNAKAPDPGRKA